MNYFDKIFFLIYFLNIFIFFRLNLILFPNCHLARGGQKGARVVGSKGKHLVAVPIQLERLRKQGQSVQLLVAWGL